MNFNQNLKAFLKQLPLGKMSGHQKFVSVAAIHSKGDSGVDVSTAEVQKQWRKSVLGVKYNSAYYDRAQGAGWVDPTGSKGKFRVTRPVFRTSRRLSPNSLPET